MTVSLNRMIAEVRKELQFRAQVYPRLIAKGKMRKSEAEYRTQTMEAILEILQDEALFRDAKEPFA